MSVTTRVASRVFAGPGVDDVLRVAAELATDGRPVALEHLPGRSDDAVAELAALVGRAHAIGLGPSCELTVPVHRVGVEGTTRLVAAAEAAGLGVLLAGPGNQVDPLARNLPAVGVVVPARDPDSEARCRRHVARHVRLTRGHGPAAARAFVRCLNVLMAGGGRPAVAATDPRSIAITDERAAWNGRAPDSWEHVMPYRIRPDEQQRLTAAGYALRVAVPSGRDAVPSPGAALLVRRLVGRS